MLKNRLSLRAASIPEEDAFPEPVRAAVPFKPLVVVLLCFAMFGMMVNGEGGCKGGIFGSGQKSGALQISGVQYKGRCFTSNSVVGTIYNNSGKTAFGNLVLKMDWYDYEGVQMDTYSHPLYGRVLRPNASTQFRIPSRRPGAWKCKVSIKNASPMDVSYY